MSESSPLMSLLDIMERFGAENCAPVFCALMQFAQVASTDKTHPEVPRHIIGDVNIALTQAQLIAAEADLTQSFMMIHRLGKQFASPVSPAELQHTIHQLIQLMTSEMAQRLFFVVTDDARYFGQERPFGDQVYDGFWSARTDATEAANCFALGRHGASVHHSMCALEPALKALADFVGVKTRAPWGSIIEKIENRIEDERKLKNPSTTFDLQFLSRAAVEFSYFKDAWRNHCAHGKAQYDRNEAQRVMDHTRAFMQALSVQLHE